MYGAGDPDAFAFGLAVGAGAGALLLATYAIRGFGASEFWPKEYAALSAAGCTIILILHAQSAAQLFAYSV